MQTPVIISVIGPDRPGLIDRLSSTVAAASGNWEGSRMLKLSGLFAGMVQVVLDDSRLSDLEAGLVALRGEGLQAHLHRPGTDDASASEGRLFDLEVVGQDRQGIVRAISGALAGLGVNVLELATDCGNAPWSGERIFRTHAKLWCPASLDTATLREAVEAIALDLMVELKNADS